MALSTLQLAAVRAMCANGSARAIRLGRSLTLREVAREVDVAPSTVLRWERNERTPRGDAAVRYHDLLVALMERAA